MWMQPEQEDEEEFAALISALSEEPLPSKEAEQPMRSAADATPMEPRSVQLTSADEIPAELEQNTVYRIPVDSANTSEPERDIVYPMVDPLPGSSPQELDRTEYPTDAPSDMAAPFYSRLARDRTLAGDSEGTDFATDRLQAYAAAPGQTSMPGASPMWEKYASQGARMGSGGGLSALAARGGGMGGPPAAQDNSVLFGLAALADFGLNKGKNTGRLLGAMGAQDAEYENYRRQMEHQKAMSDLANAGRRGYGFGQSPEALELRRQALELQRRRLDLGLDRENRLGEAHRQRFDPEQAERMRQFYIDNGVPEDVVAGMSDEQLKRGASLLNERAKQSPEMVAGAANRAGAIAHEQATQTMGPKIATAEGISKATLPDKITVAREGAIARAQGAAQSPQFQAQEAERYRAAADQYWKETEFPRTGAAFLRDAESTLAKYPEGSDIPGAGWADSRLPTDVIAAQVATGDERAKDAMRIRMAQDWMNNAIQRADSGAAAPIPEEAKFAMRSGARPGATEIEFREGMRAAAQYLRGSLASASAGKEDAARDVLRRQGIEDWVFPEAAPGLAQQTAGGESLGVTEGAGPKVDRVVQPKPRARSGKASAQASADPIAYRNGKPVARIEKHRSGNGLRVVIHYQDGSSETVERN